MARADIPWLRISAEFIAIFAGVTLSLIADDWRESREDRATEATLLQALADDLEADRDVLESQLTSMERWDQAGARLHRRLDGPELQRDSVHAYLRPVLFYSMYRPVDAAYVSLKEGGQLAVIRDSDLRNAVTRYYESEQEYMRQFYDIVIDTYWVWRRIAWTHVEVEPAQPAGTFWPIGAFVLRDSWQALVDDDRVAPALTDLSIVGGNSAERIRAALAVNDSVQTLVRASLGSR